MLSKDSAIFLEGTFLQAFGSFQSSGLKKLILLNFCQFFWLLLWRSSFLKVLSLPFPLP